MSCVNFLRHFKDTVKCTVMKNLEGMWSWKLGNAFNEISPFNHLLITVVSGHAIHCFLSTVDSSLVVNVIINLNLILDPANIVSFKSKSFSFFGIIKLVRVKARIATVS